MVLTPITLLILAVAVLLLVIFVILVILVFRALWKYLQKRDSPPEKESIQKSLGELLKSHRMERKMTQEFVAESLGVSRQAVSKWEQGKSDPSTSNLLALAKLYQIPPEDLLKNLK